MNISQDHTILYRFADWQQEKELMMSVRHPVFVVEQRVPQDIEIDELDPVCIHVIATASDGQPVGTARMADNGHIGRCAILKQWRANGIGTRLVTMLIEKAAEAGLKTVHLNSQVSAVPFYEKLGFVPNGPEFIEADIVHIPMGKNLP